MDKLSRFQKNFNDFTFYLLMLSEKCSLRDLSFYDSNCPFVENFEFLKKIESELSALIDGDNELLINQNIPSGPAIRKLIEENLNVFSESQKPEKYKKNLNRSKEEKKIIKSFLKDKYLELSYDYPLSKLDTYRIINKALFFSFLVFVCFIWSIIPLGNWNLYGKVIIIYLSLFPFVFLYSWLSYDMVMKNKGKKFLQFKRKFSTTFCYEKLIKSKSILEQILFENDPFQRLEENRLYRQIIKISPRMKIVFKLLIEEGYWHYDGFNLIKTEKCTRQLIGKIAYDLDLGINSDKSWQPICQKLMMLPEPLYDYDKGKDDMTWETIKKKLIKEFNA